MSFAGGQLRWDDLQFVISVARAGSFFRASEHLNTNASTVARRVQRLETSLGVKIFDRLAHGMQMTPAGRLLFEKALAMEAVAHEIGTRLAGLDTLPAGTIKICATEGIASFWLTSRMARFCGLYPSIDVEISTNRDDVNFLAHDTDIAVALGRPKEPRLVIQRVATAKLRLFASDGYVRRSGEPRTLEALLQHEFVDYEPHRTSPGIRDLLEGSFANQRVRMRTNSVSVFLEAIKAGVGIGLLPRFYKVTNPNLLELDISLDCESEIWLISHEETNKAHRTRLLLAYLAEEFRNDRAFWS